MSNQVERRHTDHHKNSIKPFEGFKPTPWMIRYECMICILNWHYLPSHNNHPIGVQIRERMFTGCSTGIFGCFSVLAFVWSAPTAVNPSLSLCTAAFMWGYEKQKLFGNLFACLNEVKIKNIATWKVMMKIYSLHNLTKNIMDLNG